MIYHFLKKFLTFVVIFVLAFSPLLPLTSSSQVAEAAINPQMNYQGKLLSSNGTAVADGSYQILFRLYDAASGGAVLWSETRTVTVTSGLFSVMLGATSSLLGVDFNQTLYLGVKVGTDSEMTPRKIIGTVPSAFVAQTALDSQALGGATSTQYVRTDIPSVIDVNSSSTGLSIIQRGAGNIFSAGNATDTSFVIGANGNVGIGTTTPSARLHTISTTEQLRLGYDTSNYWNATTGSTGITTFDAVGASAGFVFSDNISINTAQTADKINVGGVVATYGNGAGFAMYNVGANYTGNFEMARFMPVSNVFTFQTLQGGSGVGRDLLFAVGNARLYMNNSSGNIGIGVDSASAKLHLVKTTEQLRLGYDTSNYWSNTINSTGGLTMQGVGTGGALTLSPTAGQNVNLSLSGAGDFAVNTSQLYVDTSSGNVGIGTANPVNKFEVVGRTSLSYGFGDGAILLGADVNGTTRSTNTRKVGYIAVPTWTNNGLHIPFGFDATNSGLMQVFFGTPASGVHYGVTDLIFSTAPTPATLGGTERMRINSSGNVGIGTTTPGSKLTVVGNIDIGTTTSSTGGQLTQNGTRLLHTYGTQNTFVGLGAGNFTTTGQANTSLGEGSLSGLTSGNFNFGIGRNAGSAITSGLSNVLIGNSVGSSITTTSYNTIIGDAAGFGATGLTGVVYMGRGAGRGVSTFTDSVFLGTVAGGSADGGLQSVGSLTNVVAIGARSAVGASHTIALGAVGAYATDIVSGGTTASAKLHLIKTTEQLRLGYDASNYLSTTVGSAGLTTFNVVGTSPAFNFTGGNVGIGTTSPQRKLHVQISTDDAPVRFQDSNGYCEINPTSTTWTCTSDERLKDNIVAMETSVLERMDQLRPVTFTWKTDASNAERQGLIAQEVEAIFPELVNTDSNGFKSVSYGGFTIYFIQAIQELSKQVAGLFDGVANIFVNTLKVKEELCIDDVCIDKTQLQNLINAQAASVNTYNGGGSSSGGSTDGSTSNDTSTSDSQTDGSAGGDTTTGGSGDAAAPTPQTGTTNTDSPSAPTPTSAPSTSTSGESSAPSSSAGSESSTGPTSSGESSGSTGGDSGGTSGSGTGE